MTPQTDSPYLAIRARLLIDLMLSSKQNLTAKELAESLRDLGEGVLTAKPYCFPAIGKTVYNATKNCGSSHLFYAGTVNGRTNKTATFH